MSLPSRTHSNFDQVVMRRNSLVITPNGKTIQSDNWGVLSRGTELSQLETCVSRPVDSNALNWIGCTQFGRHYGEEPSISGTKGALTFFVHGCPFRCTTCHQTEFFESDPQFYVSSESILEYLSSKEVVEQFETLEFVVAGFHSGLYELIRKLKQTLKPNLPIVYKYAGVMPISKLTLLSQWVDIFVPDFKAISNQLCAFHGLSWSFVNQTKQNIKFLSQVSRKTIVRHLICSSFLNHRSEITEILNYLDSLNWNGSLEVSLLRHFYNPATRQLEVFPKIQIEEIIEATSLNVYSHDGVPVS